LNGLYQFDLDTFRAINIGWHQSWLNPVFWFFSYSGLGQVQVVFALLLLFRTSLKKYTWPIVSVVLVAGLAVIQVLKHSSFVDRERPSRMFETIRQEGWMDSSFPSGHTATSFGIATVIVLMTSGLPRHRWVGPVMIAWACLVGISRIYRGVHWPTDVIGGALAGIGSGCLVHLMFERFSSKSNDEVKP
jgi:undecaprenyl-diphosphatase